MNKAHVAIKKVVFGNGGERGRGRPGRYARPMHPPEFFPALAHRAAALP
ncbi:hypothetical protein [Melaminivora suipulveris]|nr:hypothetical protein [Melaminivora suipulveris]